MQTNAVIDATRATTPRATSSAALLGAITAAVESSGGDGAAFLGELQVEADLGDLDARIPYDVLCRAWELAPKWTGDACFGLHFGERTAIGAFDLIDYAARKCANLGEVFERLASYQRLLCDATRIVVVSDGDVLRVVHHSTQKRAPFHAVEAALAGWVTQARRATARDFIQRAVRFRHAAPPALDEHQRIFRSPIEFGADVDELVLNRALAAAPWANRPCGLRAVVQRHEPDASPVDFLSQARLAVAAELCGRSPTLASVAARLHISSRSLQRNLALEGLNLKKLISSTRCEWAHRYLDEGRLRTSEVAFLLGFSEPSAFHRAFRRWTGQTPQAYRARAR